MRSMILRLRRVVQHIRTVYGLTQIVTENMFKQWTAEHNHYM